MQNVLAIIGEPNIFNCCKKIKTDIQTKHIPVVILSETADETEKLKAYETGADAFISKPLDVNLLTVRINALIKILEDVRDKTQREIISNPQNIFIPSQDTKFLSDAMKVIEDNIDDEHFTLDDFARNMKVSRSILNSRMLAITKQTPIEFVRNVRLKRAAQLLKLNAYSVAEISYKVGISDPRYFSTIFKKKYGESPMQYAKNKSKENDR
ncbi:HTH-type transcriptional activator RhaR [bioreactor metagenome]|uniref:HTH-type transcriptional activator RhaR n=1 Tax=bioreactor metagenome TaxID=1076179 RepID=A0A644ZKJ9_9ZZZZ|nr:helix-turn-helix domain-containing protein [Paludibacter sp.]